MQAVAAVVLAVVSIGLLWYAWREISAMPRQTSSGLQENLRPGRTGRSRSSEDGEPGPSGQDAALATGDLDEPSAEVPAGPEAPPSEPVPVDDPDGGRLAGPSPAGPEPVGDAEPAMPRREAEETEPLGSEAPGPGFGEEPPTETPADEPATETPAPGPASGEPAAGTSDETEGEMGLPSYRPPEDQEEPAERRPPGTGSDEASPGEDAEAEMEADAGTNQKAAPRDESAADRDGNDEPSGREEEDSGSTGPTATFATGFGSAGVQAPGPDETTSEETTAEEGTAPDDAGPAPDDAAPEPETRGGAADVGPAVDFELFQVEEGSDRGYRVRRGPAGDPIPWDSLPLAEGLLAFEVAEVERHLDVAQLAEFSPGEPIRLAPEADSDDGGRSGEAASAPSPPRIGVYDSSGEYRVGYVPRDRSELVAELVAADPGYRGRVLWETTRQGQVVGLRVLITASDAAVRLP